MKHRIVTFAFAMLLASTAIVSAQENRDRFSRWDKNEDGKLIKDELPSQALRHFERMDTNRDGTATREEFEAYLKSIQRAVAPDRKSQPERVKRAAVPPTHADVSYGTHEKQAYDIWLAKSIDGEPTPLVIYIHGGGFRGGDKNGAAGHPIQDYLDAGISFASMNYRLSNVGPYPIMMHDAARGLQHIRSNAEVWNIDSDRVACYGGSAGAGISLWLAFHDDLAKQESDDLVARQSTRIVAAGTLSGQSTYDIRTFREWFDVPHLKPHPALFPLFDVKNDDDLKSDRVTKLMTDASPITHLTKDDPPVFMAYSKGDVPVDENSEPGLWVHHARLGIKLKEAMDPLKVECHVTWRGNSSDQYEDIHTFLRAKVRAKSE